jgi:hypothetical protein
MLSALCKRASQHRCALARCSQARCHAQAQVSAADSVQHFKRMLGESAVVTAADQLQQYNTDWTGHFQGSSGLALQPHSADDVSHILQYCNENRCEVLSSQHMGGLRISRTPSLLLTRAVIAVCSTIVAVGHAWPCGCMIDAVCALHHACLVILPRTKQRLVPSNALPVAHGRQRMAS